MAHALHHAQSSARRYGGREEDYIAIHSWFDASKAHYSLPQHRALRHHSAGIFEAEHVFGVSITNSAGRRVPTRFIGEQHVKEDCRAIPSVGDWLKHIPLQSWMANGAISDPVPDQIEDPRQGWIDAVAGRRTVLGLTDWIEERRSRLAEAT